MAVLKGPGAMKQLPLLATWKDSQVVKDRESGEVLGAYLDVQIDQSELTPEEVAAGKAQTNPHIESHDAKGKDGRTFKSHTVWYSKSQMDQMQSVGETVRDNDGNNGCAFTANVTQTTNAKTGEKRMIVLLPKDPEKAKTPEERAKIEKYNERNLIGPSPNEHLSPLSLQLQEEITGYARDLRDAAVGRNEPAHAAELQDNISASQKLQKTQAEPVPDPLSRSENISYLATWRDGPGKTLELDVQNDFSMMDARDVREHMADNQHLYESHGSINGMGYTTNTLTYTREQVEAMQAVGTTVKSPDGSFNICSFSMPVTAKISDRHACHNYVTNNSMTLGHLKLPTDFEGAKAAMGPSTNPNFTYDSYLHHLDIAEQSRQLDAAEKKYRSPDYEHDLPPIVNGKITGKLPAGACNSLVQGIEDFKVLSTDDNAKGKGHLFGNTEASPEVEQAVRQMTEKYGGLPLVDDMFEIVAADEEWQEAASQHDGIMLVDNIKHEIHVNLGCTTGDPVHYVAINGSSGATQSHQPYVACWYDSLERQKANERRFDVEAESEMDSDLPEFD